jgi:hypothetical protein
MGVRTASRRPTRNGDGDDWFAEAPTSASQGRAPDDATEVDDDWLREQRRPRAARRELPPVLRSRRAGLVAVALVFVLVVGLVVGGVFDDSSKVVPPATIPSTTVAPPTTQPAPVVPVPSTTLKPGDTGAQVRILQRALAAVGDSPGKIDASYGPATQAALETFQRAHQLTPDGLFGPATRRALARAVKSL